MLPGVRFLLTLAVWSLHWGLVDCISLYTRHESQGLEHVRYENGTVTWGSLYQPVVESKSEVEVSSAWKVTVDFAVAVVDSVQTHSFPYDLLRRVIRNTYTEKEVLGYQTNVVVVTGLGALLAVVILLSLMIYIGFKWRRRGKDALLFHFPPLTPLRGRLLIVFGAVFMAVDLGLLISALAASGHSMKGALQLDDSVSDAMDEVTDYFQQLHEQYNFITVNASHWLIQEVMVPDVGDVGTLVWDTGRGELLPLINTTLAAVSDLDSKVTEALTLLTSLDSGMSAALNSFADDLTMVLTKVYYNLTTAVKDYTCRGCDGSCSGCSPILPKDIFLNVDFRKLPNITSNIAGLKALSQNKVAGSMQSPEYFFTFGIGQAITRKPNVTVARKELTDALLAYAYAWGNATSSIIFPNESSFFFDTLKPKLQEFAKDVEAREIARFTFVLIFCLITLGCMGVTVAAIVIAVSKGMLRKVNPDVEVLQRPQKLLGWCVVIQVLMASALTAMAAAGFYAGANLQTSVCQPAADMQHVQQVVDYPDAIPGHSGYYLSSVLLGNGSDAPLLLSNVLKACSDGSGAYSTLMHNVSAPWLQQDLRDFSQHFRQGDAMFDLMRVDIHDVSLVPPLFSSWIENFTAFTDFNYTQYDTMLTGSVIQADVEKFAANLMVIHNTNFPDGPVDPSKLQLRIAAEQLLAQKDRLMALKTTKDNLAVIFANFTSLVSQIKATVNLTVERLKAAEPSVYANATDAISRGVSEYKNNVYTVLEEAGNQTWEWVNRAGRCSQVSDAYRQVQTSFCDQHSDYQGSTQSVNTRPFQEPPADYEDGSDDDLDDNILALDYHRKSMQSQHRPSLIIQVEPAIDYGEPGQQSQEPVSPTSHLHPLRHREQPYRADIFVTQWPPSDAASYDDMTI
ncbi:hypothetical protein C0Q70_08914 [Pomacea canaliculata]|uniref:Uncharacterized protein n=1 Tax=Pomacea canaliculata TaxID=400727 RepID=A0A2T7P8C7_POMCA|nr:hypothetical protein C0Q70_08914 [Pomacea canaliculata]